MDPASLAKRKAASALASGPSRAQASAKKQKAKEAEDARMLREAMAQVTEELGDGEGGPEPTQRAGRAQPRATAGRAEAGRFEAPPSSLPYVPYSVPAPNPTWVPPPHPSQPGPLRPPPPSPYLPVRPRAARRRFIESFALAAHAGGPAVELQLSLRHSRAGEDVRFAKLAFLARKPEELAGVAGAFGAGGVIERGLEVALESL
ncbi:hypothetical protein TeGR_g12973, partial [Tetraparma gracilis]